MKLTALLVTLIFYTYSFCSAFGVNEAAQALISLKKAQLQEKELEWLKELRRLEELQRAEERQLRNMSEFFNPKTNKYYFKHVPRTNGFSNCPLCAQRMAYTSLGPHCRSVHNPNPTSYNHHFCTKCKDNGVYTAFGTERHLNEHQMSVHEST